jgi:uncharacterized membrane protein YvbJ
MISLDVYILFTIVEVLYKMSTLNQKIIKSFKTKRRKINKFFKSLMAPKNLTLLALSIIILTAASSYFIALSFSNTKMKFLNNLKQTLESEDPYRAMNYMSFQDNALKISKDTMEPFFQYIKKDPERITSFIKSLEKEPKNKNMALLKEQKGRLGSKYIVELKPAFISISVDYKDTDIYVNQELTLNTTEDNTTSILGPYAPGVYNLKAEIQNEFGKVSEEKDLTLLDPDTELSFDLNVIKLTVNSNYSDALVYMNGENTEKQVKDFKDIGPIPMKDNITVFVEKEFPWGTVRSTETEVNTTSKIKLDINPATPELKAKLEQTYRDFYQSVFKALTSENKELITYSNREVLEEIYSKLKKDTIILRNSYSITNMAFEQDVIAVDSDIDKYTASANITISYKEQKSFWGILLPSYNEVTKKFKTTLAYDEETNSWIVSSLKEI